MPDPMFLGIAGAVVLTLLLALAVLILIRQRRKQPVQPASEVSESSRPFATISSAPPRKGNELTHLRAVAQLAQQQMESLESMEVVAEDPDLIFHLYRARHLASRMNHEAELMQIKAGEPLRATTLEPISAASLARSAVEGATAFENVRVEIIEDFGLRARAIPALRNLLIQLLDRAGEAERFGRVHLRIEKQDSMGVFQVTDHGQEMTQAELDASIAAMQAGLSPIAGAPRDTSAPGWTIGAAIRDLPVEVVLTSDGRGAGTTAIVRLDPEDIVGIAQVAGARSLAQPPKRPVQVSLTSPIPTTQPYMADPTPMRQTSPVRAQEESANAHDSSIPPLYRVAIDKFELEQTMTRTRSERPEWQRPLALQPPRPTLEGRSITYSR